MTLHDKLLAAHAQNDKAALVTLYAEAADLAANTDQTCFFLTQAYVYALEQGDGAQDALYQRLKAFGRV